MGIASSYGAGRKPPPQRTYLTPREAERVGSELIAGGVTRPTQKDYISYARLRWPAGGRQPGGTPTLPAPRRPGGPGGGGRGGGGGGGPAGMNQAQLDWAAGLLRGGAPQPVGFNALDLPEYQGQFDPTMYNELEGRFNEAVGIDRQAAAEANRNLVNYLTTNFRNAYAAGPPQQQAQGMDQLAMQRMMQAQGVNPALAAEGERGAAAGNAAFSNIWGLLGANEQMAQQNRLNRAQTDLGTTNRALDIAALQGRTGIGLQRSQAQAAWQQRADELRAQIAQQEAMANWQRQNELATSNAANLQTYRNQQIEALLGLLPQTFGTNLTLPDLAGMGLG